MSEAADRWMAFAYEDLQMAELKRRGAAGKVKADHETG